MRNNKAVKSKKPLEFHTLSFLQVLKKMKACMVVLCPHWSVHKTKVITVHLNWKSCLFYWIL